MRNRSNFFGQSGPSDNFRWALLISLAIHALFLAGMRFSPSSSPATPIEVSIVKLDPPKIINREQKKPLLKIPQPERQIVSPSKAKEADAAPNTNKLSDRNTATDREQIKRGVVDAKTQTQQKARKPVLKLSSRQLNKQFSTTATDTSGNNAASMNNPHPSKDDSLVRQQKLDEYKPFRKSVAASLQAGALGVPDFLPHIPDGDITLLNAKADRHAVFVRRVALQVFGALRRLHWAELPFREVKTIRDFSTVEATMNLNGEFLGLKLTTPSGSVSFDKAVIGATQEGAWDKNPPETAKASDGNIHFIFKSRTWARPGFDGTPEQRWLLLATGLK